MKRIIIYCSYLLTAAMLFTACRKSDNPKLPALTKFPLPTLAKVAGTDQVISALTPDAFSGKFTVDMYFKDGVPADKLDVVVIKNGNKSVVKTIQANVTTYPSTLTVTGAQLAALFGGTPIVLGDKFDIGVDVTSQGVKYEGFPLVGAPYASGISTQPGEATFVRYEAVCKYDPNQYQGNFTVVSDDWADYAPGNNVTLTMIDSKHFSFKYLAANAVPIIVSVDPNTNIVSVTKQVYGSGYPPGWPYGDISCESVPSVDDFVAPCSGIFSIRLKHTVAAGSFGEAVLVLQKP